MNTERQHPRNEAYLELKPGPCSKNRGRRRKHATCRIEFEQIYEAAENTQNLKTKASIT